MSSQQKILTSKHAVIRLALRHSKLPSNYFAIMTNRHQVSINSTLNSKGELRLKSYKADQNRTAEYILPGLSTTERFKIHSCSEYRE